MRVGEGVERTTVMTVVGEEVLLSSAVLLIYKITRFVWDHTDAKKSYYFQMCTIQNCNCKIISLGS